ncbi:conserved exported hypothetical protein [Enterobacterales bacterium 8AC]|nr:conserved exported hypothetical protein [Enterobacterales bacterium 8AC]
MMKKNRHRTILLLMLGSTLHPVAADPVQVNITGKVIASPCSLDTANSDLAIDLGNIKVASMKVPGTYGGTERLFNLVLKNCPSNTSRVVATFSGVADEDDATLFANTGSAKGVGIKVKTRDEPYSATTVRPDQSTWVLPVESATKSANLAFASRVYTTTGNVTTGTISAVMQVTFTYQ